MPVHVETHTVITDSENRSWKFGKGMIRDVAGRRFLKLPGSNCPALVKLVHNDDPPDGQTFSRLQGVVALKSLRTSVQRSLENTPAEVGAAAFFGETAANKQKEEHGSGR